MDKKNRLYYSSMILCFLFAGTCLLQILYTGIMLRGSLEIPEERANEILNISNNSSLARICERDCRPRRVNIPMVITAFPFIGFFTSLLAGFSMLDMLRKKEKRKITKEIMNTMLRPDEMKIVEALEDNDGELTQSHIVKITKLSKVKASRIIKKLESMGIVKKYGYGVTNKIRLEKRQEKS